MVIVEKFDTMKQAQERARQLKRIYGDQVKIDNIINRWAFCLVELVYTIKAE